MQPQWLDTISDWLVRCMYFPALLIGLMFDEEHKFANWQLRLIGLAQLLWLPAALICLLLAYALTELARVVYAFDGGVTDV